MAADGSLGEFDKRVVEAVRKFMGEVVAITNDARDAADAHDAEMDELKNKLTVAERTITLQTTQVTIAQKREHEALNKIESQGRYIIQLETDLQDIKDRFDRIPARAPRPGPDTPFAKVGADVERSAAILRGMEDEMTEPLPAPSMEPLEAISKHMRALLGGERKQAAQ